MYLLHIVDDRRAASSFSIVGLNQSTSEKKSTAMQDTITKSMDNVKSSDTDASSTCFEKTRLGSEHADSWKSQNVAYVRLRTTSSSFFTDPSSWLGHSTFFEALFAGKSGSALADGSFFIDCDGELFGHILRYLRTGVLPLFYDTTNGHDFAQYHVLLGEAEYFGIDRLCKWLRSKRYLDAVDVRDVDATSSDLSPYTRCRASEGPDRRFPEVLTDDRTNILPVSKIQQQSVCRHLAETHGINTQGDRWHCSNKTVNGGASIKEVVEWSIVRREIVFDHDLCVNAFSDDVDSSPTLI